MADLDQARSIYELMVLAAWADGELGPAEVLASRGMLAQFPDLERVNDADQLARKAKARLDAVGLTKAISEAAAGLRDREHRERAFVCCARMLEADGKISVEEFGVLVALRDLFQLNDQDVARLLAEAARPGSPS